MWGKLNKCIICEKEHKNKKYCSIICRDIGRRGKPTLAKGRPKPNIRGENNPNFGNKSQHNNGGYEKLCKAAKKRGQAWDEELRRQHSERMSGPSNAMRGKKHSKETKEKISITKIRQYENGEIKFNAINSSSQELEISNYFKDNNINFVQQFQIYGHSFFYDFYLPELNIIIEFNGDYWHANPEKYKSGTTLNIQNAEPVLVDKIWERDKLKRIIAEENGYKIFYIWESDYKKFGFKCVEEIIGNCDG